MKLLALLFAGFSSGTLLLRFSDGPYYPLHLITSGALGLVVLSWIACLAWLFGVPPEQSIIGFAILIGIIALPSLFRARLQFKHARCPRFDLAHATSLAVVLVYAFPVLYASAVMGAGEAPPVFFNVDVPYYLSQVHALVRASEFPPESLNTKGIYLPYHYGVQLAGAIIVRLGSLPAHQAFCWVVIPTLLLGKVAVIWRIASLSATRGVPHWLGVLCLLFLVEYPVHLLYERVISQLFVNPAKAWSRAIDLLFSGERLDAGYPLPSSLAGSFLVYTIALFMLDSKLRYRLVGISICYGALALFKVPYLLPVGIWVGTWAAYSSVVHGRYASMIAALVGCSLALLLSATTVLPGFVIALNTSPSTADAIWQSEIVQLVTSYGAPLLIAMLCVVILTTAPQGPGLIPIGTGTLFVGCSLLILCLPILLLVTFTDSTGAVHFTMETQQWLPPAKWIAGVGIIAAAGRTWLQIRTRWQYAVVTLIVGYSALPLLAKVNDAVVLTGKPDAWHDFADNRAIMAALKAVPVEGSVIATNDLSYPAGNYARERRQFQIAALFGHQAYAAAVLYDLPPDAEQRVQEQSLLRRPEWSSVLDKIACSRSWTHILLSKRLPFVRSPPGRLLYESDFYSVYELPLCGPPGGSSRSF